jgi:hypothetical protein
MRMRSLFCAVVMLFLEQRTISLDLTQLLQSYYDAMCVGVGHSCDRERLFF